MRSLLFLFIFINWCTSSAAPFWGKTGHRTIGAIAEKHLCKKTAKKIAKLLNNKSLAYVSIHSDEIKSDPKYNKYFPWHYVNFPPNANYDEHPVNKKGDIVQGIKTCILNIRDANVSKNDKAFFIKLLVHLVGDLHQPLHVGNAHDKGGNSIKLQWFYDDSNLHRVWDSEMIDYYKMSYSELSNNTAQLSKTKINEIKSGRLLDWVYESKKLATEVYDSAKPGQNLTYKYMYHQFPLVQQQLQKGGIRLAHMLTEIFKKKSDWTTAFLNKL